QGDIIDPRGVNLVLLPEVKKVFNRIKKADYEIAFTSRTVKPELTNDLVKLLDLQKYSSFNVFNNESKNKQLAEVSTRTGVPLKQIIYFDTIEENVEEVKPLGACTFLIPDEGLTLDTFIVSMKNACLSFNLDLDSLGITWGNK
ncbi:MAG: hypothetical protein ACP5E3_05950, partial [Bacteroidales bacterium]